MQIDIIILEKISIFLMGIGNQTVRCEGVIDIFLDHTLLVHSHEHQNLTNNFELIGVDRNFG